MKSATALLALVLMLATAGMATAGGVPDDVDETLKRNPFTKCYYYVAQSVLQKDPTFECPMNSDAPADVDPDFIWDHVPDNYPPFKGLRCFVEGVASGNPFVMCPRAGPGLA